MYPNVKQLLTVEKIRVVSVAPSKSARSTALSTSVRIMPVSSKMMLCTTVNARHPPLRLAVKKVVPVARIVV